MTTLAGTQEKPEDQARQSAMSLLAQASAEELGSVWDELKPRPDVTAVRGPETGLVMVRGRMGGGGDAFNLGEATVSRATVRLSSGEIGHGHMLGTDRQKVRLAAIFDALFQTPDYRASVEALLGRIRLRIEEEDRNRDRETAATRVDFFTLVRGDD